jgi:hypothetical protein
MESQHIEPESKKEDAASFVKTMIGAEQERA